jgi:hypothetical protein
MKCSVFLFGDSHMGALNSGAKIVGVRAGGGIVIPQSYIGRGAMKFDDKKCFTFREVKNSNDTKPIDLYEKRFVQLLNSAGYGAVEEIDVPVITDFGCNPSIIVKALADFSFDPTSPKRYMSRGLIREILLDRMAEQIQIARWLHAHLLKVCFVFPPIGANVSREIWLYCENVLSDIYRSMGAHVYSSVSWACDDNPDGWLLPEYRVERDGVPDLVHGNAQFGARVVVDCMQLLSMIAA